MRTKLYIASCAALEDEARFAQLAAGIPAARREKLALLRNGQARRLSLAASLLLCRALEDEGLRASEIAVTQHGKPFLPALPDFHFSLSHSGDTALCAASSRPVGCDVELPRRFEPRLARRFFHPAECEWLFSHAEAEQAAAFFRLWTCKESFVKALGRGLSLPLDSFSVIPGDPAALSQTADARPWRLRSFRKGAAFCALCGLDGVEDAPLISVDLREVKP